MTAPELRCLDFVRDFLTAHGRGPTVREVMEGMGRASPGSTHVLLTRLAAKGRVETSTRKGGITIPGHVDLTGVPTARLLSELRRRDALAAA